jgi:hypothetical protein
MNIFELSVIQSYSIAIAAIIGLVRFGKVSRSYQPFIILCWVALLGEIISTVAAYRVGTNAANANIYVLVESLLFMWLFRNWGAFAARKDIFIAMIALLVSVWLYDNLIWHNLGQFNSFFRIFYSFCLIFLAIEQLNKDIVRQTGSMLKEPSFLICIGILIFYSYKATIEVFYLLQLDVSYEFYNRVHFILEIINLFVNLVYAVAIIWMRKKQRFMLPF